MFVGSHCAKERVGGSLCLQDDSPAESSEIDCDFMLCSELVAYNFRSCALKKGLVGYEKL